jgi:hypothetical protein
VTGLGTGLGGERAFGASLLADDHRLDRVIAGRNGAYIPRGEFGCGWPACRNPVGPVGRLAFEGTFPDDLQLKPASDLRPSLLRGPSRTYVTLEIVGMGGECETNHS